MLIRLFPLLGTRFVNGRVSVRVGLVVALAVVHLCLTIGCGEPEPIDEQEVSVTIANLSEAAADPKAFQSFFVDGAAPDTLKRRRYRRYFYEMDSPKITGNSATALVRITDAQGEVLGEKQWVFSKVNMQWKIRDAPLP